MNTGILIFFFVLKLAITPDYTIVDIMNQNYFKGYMEATAGLELLNKIYLKATTRTYVEYTNFQYLFAPYQADYTIELGIKPWDWLEIGFKHTCYHPVISGWKIDEKITQYLDTKEEIYLQISGKMVLF
jgi:hypothetical protein